MSLDRYMTQSSDKDNWFLANRQINQRDFLLHIKHQALQVFAFGMVDVDGMVGGLVELMEDAHLTAGLSRCSEDGGAELVLIYCLGATEGEEDAACGEFLESLIVQACVAF